MGQRSSRATTPKTWLEPLRILLGLVHQRRCSDLFGSLVDALTAKVRLMVILGLIVRETD